MTTELLKCVEVNPTGKPKASVIWLHGLGATGHDFESIVPELHLPENLSVRFVFPHAPIRPVSLNRGYQMPAWFDIAVIDMNVAIDEAGMNESVRAIGALIAREVSLGVPTQKIVLAGFSQGGAVALYTGLCYSQSLAGLMGLSTFLPLAQPIAQNLNPANRQTPIFLAHGTQDFMVPLQLGEMTRDGLIKSGHQVEWHTYPMGHEVCQAEIKDISKWLQKVLS